MFLQNTSLLSIPIIILIFMIATQRKHFLMALLTLEAITLVISLYIMLASSMISNNLPFIIMFILTMGATEASLGLSLLVSLTRHTGNDNLSNLTSLKC